MEQFRFIGSVRLVVGVLGEGDSVEEAGDDEGKNRQRDQLSSQGGLLLRNLFHLVIGSFFSLHLSL